MIKPFQLLFMLLLTALPGPGVRCAAQRTPAPAMPRQWDYTGVEQTLPSDDRWWEGFGDATLDTLVTMGEEANYDVAMALRRMEAARAMIGSARAGYFPTVGVDAAYRRERQDGTDMNMYSLGANASWQIDLFGKITAAVREKKESFRASRADYAGTMVSVAASIASTYIQLRVLQAELQMAEEHISRQDTVAGIARTRFECGLAPKTDVDQADMILYSTRATMPGLRVSIRAAVNSLAILTAREASDIEALTRQPARLPEYRRLISAGVPAELLRRRPDIVAAEHNLAAAAAAAGIARKEFLPTLAIEGSIGVAGDGHGKFFSGRNLTYSVGPTLSWTVFDGLARRANAAAARLEEEALVEQYRQTVATAVSEVDNALCSYTESLRAIDDYDRADRAAGEFLRLALDLYTQGLSSFTDVANAQMSYLEYNNSLIAARGRALGALVDLYKALGGGYIEEP